MRPLVLLAVAAAVACSAPHDGAQHAGAEQPAGDVIPDDTSPAVQPDTGWRAPGSGPITLHRARSVDFTGDGRAERVELRAAGERYDSLHIALDIIGADGDTLWHEQWQSRMYFIYIDIDTMTHTAIARTVQDHVDALLAERHFNRSGGLPEPLRRGGNPADIMREAARYHLAELDWRRAAGLKPTQPTPPEAWREIEADRVTAERVEAVLQDLRSRPSYMFFTGGEATYAIAWSERERSFIRIYACC